VTTTFDFQDGNGPVPAHRHTTGGGWVADTATVEETAYVGPDARVYGDAVVFGNARVYGDARVFSGQPPSKVYALLSTHYHALQGIFATQLGAEQARGKLDFPTTILEWEVGP